MKLGNERVFSLVLYILIQFQQDYEKNILLIYDAWHRSN
jgi:hypothetical protein